MLQCQYTQTLREGAREGLIEKLTLESKTEGSKGASHANIQGKRLPGKKKNNCKDPKMELCLL